MRELLAPVQFIERFRDGAEMVQERLAWDALKAFGAVEVEQVAQGPAAHVGDDHHAPRQSPEHFALGQRRVAQGLKPGQVFRGEAADIEETVGHALPAFGILDGPEATQRGSPHAGQESIAGEGDAGGLRQARRAFHRRHRPRFGDRRFRERTGGQGRQVGER